MPRLRIPRTPTERTLALMRLFGWRCFVVERDVRHRDRHYKQDLCGFDVLALRERERPTLIQVTTTGNAAARRAKLTRVPTPAQRGGNAPAGLVNTELLLLTGFRLLVHGWDKRGLSEWRAEMVGYTGYCGDIVWHKTQGGE